mmetsp:Transcript_12188/g.29766  ORF Transcript_12188/g.29766 Transcript_12188/m.29766 type:complete len:268 (-) Transcript_12188:1357-2160(-)
MALIATAPITHHCSLGTPAAVSAEFSLVTVSTTASASVSKCGATLLAPIAPATALPVSIAIQATLVVSTTVTSAPFSVSSYSLGRRTKVGAARMIMRSTFLSILVGVPLWILITTSFCRRGGTSLGMPLPTSAAWSLLSSVGPVPITSAAAPLATVMLVRRAVMMATAPLSATFVRVATAAVAATIIRTASASRAAVMISFVFMAAPIPAAPGTMTASAFVSAMGPALGAAVAFLSAAFGETLRVALWLGIEVSSFLSLFILLSTFL